MRGPQMRGMRQEEGGETLHFLQLVPSIVTITGMCLGLTALRYVIAERYEAAVILILLAAVLDGLDGLIARRLRVTSNFGAELDSLADFFNFGVLPAILVYQFALTGAGGIGWVFVLVYVISACLRLARFNVARGQEENSPKHFTGVPSPAGAMLALLPVFLSNAGIVTAPMPIPTALWIGLVGGLMISRIPTFSPKTLRIPRGRSALVLLGTAIVVGMIFTRFWLLLVIVDLIYCAALVHAVVRRRGRIV